MRRFIFPFMLLVFMTAPLAALAEPDMQEGMWEIKTTTEMPGMAFTMPAVSFSQCITKEDLVPRQQAPQQDCELLEHRIEGDTVTWEMRCVSEGGGLTSSGRVIYHGDTFEGNIETTGEQIPGGMQQTMRGRRVGPCP